MTVDAPDGAVVPESELLAMLASVWEPDFGDVSDDDILDALEDDAGFIVGNPVVGRFGYLSAARAALVPDGPKAVHQDTLDGGMLLHISTLGDIDTIVHMYGRLRDVGALAPLRRPLDRPTL